MLTINLLHCRKPQFFSASIYVQIRGVNSKDALSQLGLPEPHLFALHYLIICIKIFSFSLFSHSYVIQRYIPDSLLIYKLKFFQASFQLSKLKDNRDKVLLNMCMARTKNSRIIMDLMQKASSAHLTHIPQTKQNIPNKTKKLLSDGGIHFAHKHSACLKRTVKRATECIT